jgi:hypothetical protein
MHDHGSVSTASSASGLLATFTSRTFLPVSSTMQTLVSLTDTSNPAKWSMLRFSFRGLRPLPRTSFHHQPDAQHPKSSAIHKLPANYPIFWSNVAAAMEVDDLDTVLSGDPRFSGVPFSGQNTTPSIVP